MFGAKLIQQKLFAESVPLMIKKERKDKQERNFESHEHRYTYNIHPKLMAHNSHSLYYYFYIENT